VNCAFFRLLASVGPDAAIDMAHRLGITQPLQPNLSMTLGTTEATPLEMATVAATIANNGYHNSPIFVQKVTKPNGKVIFDETGRPAFPVVDSSVTACATDILQGVVTGGTGTAARLPDRPAAGKTGTTDRQADAVFLGYVPQLATVVWHGAIDAATSGAGYGGEIPATIWNRYMAAQMAGKEVIQFPPAGPVCAGEGQLITDTGRTDLSLLDDFFRNERRRQRQEDRRRNQPPPPVATIPPPPTLPQTLPPPPTLDP
jgi:penicillin-binding protein 1A